MNPHRALNWFLASLIAATMSTAYLLDMPTEQQARTDTARTGADTQRSAQQHTRFVRAARKACGDAPGAFALLEDGSIQCLSQGQTTLLAKVAL